MWTKFGRKYAYITNDGETKCIADIVNTEEINQKLRVGVRPIKLKNKKMKNKYQEETNLQKLE